MLYTIRRAGGASAHKPTAEAQLRAIWLICLIRPGRAGLRAALGRVLRNPRARFWHLPVRFCTRWGKARAVFSFARNLSRTVKTQQAASWGCCTEWPGLLPFLKHRGLLRCLALVALQYASVQAIRERSSGHQELQQVLRRHGLGPLKKSACNGLW